MKKLFVSLLVAVMLMGPFLAVPAEARARDCMEEWNACMKIIKDRAGCTLLWNYCHTHNW